MQSQNLSANIPSVHSVCSIPLAPCQPEVEIINGKPVTTSLKVAEFFGKRHDHVLRDIKNILETVQHFAAPNFGVSEYKDSTGRFLTMYVMDKDAFTLLVMGYTGSEAMQFKLAYIARFNEMEDYLRNQHLALPDFSNRAAAARAWADQVERAEKAELDKRIAEQARLKAERVAAEAIRTKALIGSAREATSMATASAATRKVAKLENELGIGRDYKQVRAISWLDKIFNMRLSNAYSIIGKKLVEISHELNCPPRDMADSKFGTVKTYHISVINKFLERLNNDPELLSKYRRF